MKVFGLTVSMKIDFPALVALVIATVTAVYQLSWWLTGANVSLLPVSQVYIGVFYPDNTKFLPDTDRDGYIKFAVEMGYVNTSTPQYNAAVLNEQIVATLAGNNYEHQWYYYAKNNDKHWSGISYSSDARAFAIAGSSVVGHTTFFTAHPVKCDGCDQYQNYLRWSQFKPILDSNETTRINFEMKGVLQDKSVVTTECTVVLTSQLKKIIRARGWIAPTCEEMVPA
ncbi:MAG: hypothetical protein V7776_03305 [Halopseudomonas aestusnigri]